MAAKSMTHSSVATKLQTLFFAVESGNVKDTKRLLTMYGFQPMLPMPSPSGSTVLHKAAICKSPELMKLLLSYRVIDINKLEDHINGGFAAVHICCQQNNALCLQALLEAGADSNIRARSKLGETPLHICCKLGYESCARLLLLHGASPDSSDGFGHSPSFWAYSRRHLDMITNLNLPPPRAASAAEHLAANGGKIPAVKKKGKKKTGGGKKK